MIIIVVNLRSAIINLNIIIKNFLKFSQIFSKCKLSLLNLVGKAEVLDPNSVHYPKVYIKELE